jgi:ABC-type enterochelin transport system permease subunit
LKRIVFTIRRTAHIVVASIALELALDFGAGAVAVLLAPFVGTWIYAAAAVIVIGSLPVLGLNVARVARREWKAHARKRAV